MRAAEKMSEGVEARDLKQYFKAARSWDHDRAQEALKQKRIAYLVAGGSSAIALATLVWHAVSPLRTIEPYVIRVNQASGGVDVVRALRDSGTITGDEAVSKYFLSDYVRKRESWIAPASSELFRAVALMSMPTEQEKFAWERRRENPDSPVNLFKGGETVGIRVTGVTFINERVAQVHFTKNVQPPGAGGDVSSGWIATINFKYLERPETEADRLSNPLGFQVVSYRADPEVPQ